jgi:serine/threonine-protein kinase
LPVCIRCKSVVVEEARFCPHCGTPQAFVRLPSKVESGTSLTLEDWGKVVVGDIIGEGGMGVVHRGWLYYDPVGRYTGTPAHPVAIKVLNPLLRGKDRARQLFLREAQALARLSHPNIVHFFGLVQEEGQLALVIELVEGEALSSLIERHAETARGAAIPCMSFMLAWHYFSQLLGALAAIHALGVIHRDVKPGNLLVRADGVLKLTDFGIARVPADEARSTGGMAPGTGAYMSPEQVKGSDLDARADLYSAAIVLYEMLTSVTPFDSPERNELMVRAAQLDEAPPPLTRLVPKAPPVLDVLLSRALAKDPMHRFSSALEMGEAFRSALSLPASPGWQAQQRLAQNARAISQIGLPAAEAEVLRTDVMQAYKQP